MFSLNELRKLLMHNTRAIERLEVESEPLINFSLNDGSVYRLLMSQVRDLRLEEFVERREPSPRRR